MKLEFNDENLKKSIDEQTKLLRKTIAQEYADISKYPEEEYPVSVFMAGSPGAGKTEASINLINKLTNGKNNILRIDTDELRHKYMEYNGSNSSSFIRGTSVLLDIIHDFALKNKQSFVFDGTLTNLNRSRENIRRSLNLGRFVQILYVYQEPLQAWIFVQAREKSEGRNVPKEAFIEKYFTARLNVNILKEEFGKNIQVDLIIKNINSLEFLYKENIETIDNYVPELYTEEELKKSIHV